MSRKVIRPAFTVAAGGMLLAAMCLPAHADVRPVEPNAAAATAAISNAPCDDDGTTSADATLAAQLNDTLTDKLDGYMTAYRVSCARMITKAVRNRDMASRAAVIAITTAIVESGLQNHDEVTDHTSLGLFQQQAPWGSAADRLDPIWATNAFLDKMIRLYPNNSWASEPVGKVAQEVQVSAYPQRYPVEVSDATKIVNAVWNYASDRHGPSINGDVRADLLVHGTDGEIAVRYNQGNYFDGGRLFTQGWGNFLGTPGKGRLYFADVNGDAKTDLLVHETDGDISVRYNQGTYFDGGRIITQNWSNFLGNSGQGKLYFADVNGDAKADLLVHGTDGEIAVRYNKGTYFDGGRLFTQGWSNFLGESGQGKLYFG
jgi:hypothetical protein